jgi:hypothetical protein
MSELEIQLSCSPSEVPADGQEQAVKLRLRVRPSEALRTSNKGAREKGADICLVLDTSGSMNFITNPEDGVPTGMTGQLEDGPTRILDHEARRVQERCQAATCETTRV